MMTRVVILGLAALGLAGCATPITPASIYQGECRVFQDPGFRVRGLRTKDNRWIATSQEAGIQVCGWKRPPSMPEPDTALADCGTVRQAVALFGGDVARAEAYAVSQGATPEQIVAARACLEQPAVVKAPGLGARHRMTKRQQIRYVESTPMPPSSPAVSPPVSSVVAAPAAAQPAVVPPPVVAGPVVSAPVVAKTKKCKARKYRWQYWRPKTCP